MAVRIVYVACGDAREIAAFRMEPTSGALRRVGTTTIPGQTEPSSTSPLAISPDRRRLHASLRLAPFPVSTFAIDPNDGMLRLLSTASLPDSMAYIATDQSGRWLLGASYGGGIVSASFIGGEGVVAGPAHQIAKTPPKAHSVLVDAANQFVYAASLGGDAVLCWRFDAARGLVMPDAPALTRTRPGSGPRHLAFGRGETVLYAVNELDGTVDVFGRDRATGALVARQNISTLAAVAPGDAAAADIHVTPDGRYLYASVRRDSVIAAFSVNPMDGTLSFVQRVDVEPVPRGFAIDPDGRILICAGKDIGKIGVYAIDNGSGRLARIATHETGGNPNWVEIIDLPASENP